ncbi:MAG: transcriptional regulator, partial [Acidiferrobacterales bacterium]
ASIERSPRTIGAHIGLTVAYAESGQQEEARARAAKILELNPKFTIAKYTDALTYRDPAYAERAINALRQAGLPE